MNQKFKEFNDNNIMTKTCCQKQIGKFCISINVSRDHTFVSSVRKRRTFNGGGKPTKKCKRCAVNTCSCK